MGASRACPDSKQSVLFCKDKTQLAFYGLQSKKCWSFRGDELFFFFFFPLKFSFMLQMYVLTAPKNKQTEKPLTGTCQYIFPLSPVKEVPPALPWWMGGKCFLQLIKRNKIPCPSQRRNSTIGRVAWDHVLVCKRISFVKMFPLKPVMNMDVFPLEKVLIKFSN